jgi:hypothetical protein
MGSFQFSGGAWQGQPLVTLTVEITPPPQTVLANILAMYDRMEDLSPILAQLPEKVIFPAVQELFASEGFGSWKFKGYQSSPPMVKTGLMKRGLTTRDPMLNRITVTKDSLSFQLQTNAFLTASRRDLFERRMAGRYSGYGVFYPGIHQHGWKRHNQNVILGLRDEDVDKAAQLIVDYIMNG